MSPSPDQPPPKPKYTVQKRRAWREDQWKTARLRMAIWQELNARGITTPDGIGEALGMSAVEAHKLLTWRRRGSKLVALEEAAARLGAQIPAPWRGRADTAD